MNKKSKVKRKEGGFTKMNEYTYKLESDKVSGMSKLIYLIICFHQLGYDRFTPGVQMMSQCYGIGIKAYNKAKRELSEAGLIEIKKAPYNGARDEVIITDKGDLGKYREIPNAIISTPCFTPRHKLFLCLLYHIMYFNHETRDRTVYLSANKIAERLADKGMSYVTVLSCIRDLKSNRYVKILKKSGKEYSIDMHVLIALYDFNPKLNKRYGYPEYKKVEPGDYTYDPETGAIIKNY